MRKFKAGLTGNTHASSSTQGCKYSIIVLLLGLLFVHTFAAAIGKADKKLDIRILVDVSQNMKLSDAPEYRKASLKLFTKLLPNGANVGVWMFDDMVTEIVPLSKVGEFWRREVLKSLEKIHSKGKASHLEKALAVASLDWVVADNRTKRHIVVLTDGKVTLGGTNAANVASKGRIEKYQIDRLKSLGVSVHIIALSDKGDKKMLEKIATETMGWYDQVKNPKHLERILLRVNKRLIRKNSIPIVANKFLIDDGVKQFTAVVFRKKGFGSTQLDDPEGMDFGKDSKRSGVDWHREKRYDIVTVTNPMEGEWRLVAAADPDNEIFILKGLQMAVDNLPEAFVAGADSRIRMLLAEQGRLLTNVNFLNAIQATVELTDKQGEKTVFVMEQDMINGGYFFADIGKDLEVGGYELVVRAKGNTFERIEMMTINVKAAPKITKIELKAEFRKVLADSGIEVSENIQQEETLVCPDVVDNAKVITEAEKPSEEDIVAEKTNWMLTLGIVLLVNILLAAAGFFGYRWYKKKSAMADDELVNKVIT
ncbi:MAG: hypothetical protein COB62_03995 [Piscirickettsiaceae bacterium]|nr:MAG: hypothetical protein COB62_03995 [Piscirickettsiaceae bacterium]